jgi:hypothetical protein
LLKLVGPIGAERAELHSRFEISTVCSKDSEMSCQCKKRYLYALNKNFDFALHRDEGAVFGQRLTGALSGHANSTETATILPAMEGIPT